MPELQQEEEQREQEEFLEQLMFSDLVETKVEVRARCNYCDGKGVKHGEECSVCNGDKFVVQSMSLYKLTKKLMPLIVQSMKKLMLEMAEQSR